MPPKVKSGRKSKVLKLGKETLQHGAATKQIESEAHTSKRNPSITNDPNPCVEHEDHDFEREE